MSRSAGAQIIHLNAKASSTRNNGAPFDGSYTCPPPCNVPYGWKLESGRAEWRLIHDPYEWGIISWIIGELQAGASYRDVAERLQQAKVPAPVCGRTERRWNGERVRTLAQSYAPELRRPKRREDRLSELHALTLSELTPDERRELAELEAAELAAVEDW